MPDTSSPRSSSFWAVCMPIKPHTPVTRTFIVISIAHLDAASYVPYMKNHLQSKREELSPRNGNLDARAIRAGPVQVSGRRDTRPFLGSFTSGRLDLLVSKMSGL